MASADHEMESLPRVGVRVVTPQLRTCALFQHVPAPALHELGRAAREVRVPRGGAFYEQGERASTIHALLRGLVKLVWLGTATQRVIVGFVEPGESFDLVAMVSNAAHRCSAHAAEDSLALAWSRPVMVRAIERYPHIGANALRLLAGRLSEARDAYGGLATAPVEPRLARMLARLTQARDTADASAAPSLRLGQRDLAACIGTTPFTVSRILSQWRRDGLVDVRRERVVIQHRNRLEQIAEGGAGEVSNPSAARSGRPPRVGATGVSAVLR
jgi:CRP/FNR family transcriptional regulator, nitrogen oxide reductase regulator